MPQALHDLVEVVFSPETPSFVTAQRARGAKRLGLKYEKEAQPLLAKACHESPKVVEYLPSPWFKYRCASHPTRWNYAQPDGLAIAPNEGLVFVVEIKLRHTADSYFQLLDRYIPLMEKFFGKDWKFCPVEVCRWYDPHTAYPTRISLRENFLDAKPTEVTVHRLRTD
jgi:hypothetical protein